MKFCRADQVKLADGWYWIQRCKEGWKAPWEIAYFEADGSEAQWTLVGTSTFYGPTTSPLASNAWLLGPRVECPDT